MQFDDGDKKDMAYDNYTIRFPAICEFYIPINYVLKSPELIPSAVGKPSLIDDELLIDPIPDENNNVQLLKIIKKYKDEATRCFIDTETFSLIGRDEFVLEKPEDYYDIRSILTQKDRDIFDSLSTEEKKQCFQVYLFEDDVLLDEGKYFTIDYDTWHIIIHQGNINKLQMIEVYADIKLINTFKKQQLLQKNIKQGLYHARNK
jgi:hypothetical protein